MASSPCRAAFWVVLRPSWKYAKGEKKSLYAPAQLWLSDRMLSCCLYALRAKRLGGFHVVLGLLAQRLHSVARPALHELGVALLVLQEPHAAREPLLGSPGILLLQPHELKPAFCKPDTPALGGSEVLGERLVRVALNLSHLAGRTRRLLDVSCGGLHHLTSVIVGHLH